MTKLTNYLWAGAAALGLAGASLLFPNKSEAKIEVPKASFSLNLFSPNVITERRTVTDITPDFFGMFPEGIRYDHTDKLERQIVIPSVSGNLELATPFNIKSFNIITGASLDAKLETIKGTMERSTLVNGILGTTEDGDYSLSKFNASFKLLRDMAEYNGFLLTAGAGLGIKTENEKRALEQISGIGTTTSVDSSQDTALSGPCLSLLVTYDPEESKTFAELGADVNIFFGGKEIYKVNFDYTGSVGDFASKRTRTAKGIDLAIFATIGRRVSQDPLTRAELSGFYNSFSKSIVQKKTTGEYEKVYEVFEALRRRYGVKFALECLGYLELAVTIEAEKYSTDGTLTTRGDSISRHIWSLAFKKAI